MADTTAQEVSPPPAEVDYSLLWRVLALFSLILVVTLYWNRRLRREMRRRRNAERILAQSERRFREMVESAGAEDFHFYSLAPDGTFDYASPSSLEFFGIDAEAMIGKHWRDIAAWSEPAIGQFEEAIRTCLRGEVPNPVTLESTTELGRQQFISHPRPVKDEQGRTVRIEGISVNLTPRLLLEEHLFQAIAAAQEADRTKSAFLATMSHEIRTPMNTVLGMLHLCLETPLNEQQQGYVRAAQRASGSLLQLLNDVLDVSKAEAGRLTLESEPFALREITDGLTALMARRGRNPDLKFGLALDPEIPPTLVGDPLRLGQVLTNLVDNAVKFTERGTIELSIRLLERQGQRVHLEFRVRDTGIGIEPSKVSNLFEPFRQADSSITRRYGGTGLGLSICRRLVELMEGSIAVTSQPGVGSTFRFDIWLEAALGHRGSSSAHSGDRPALPEAPVTEIPDQAILNAAPPDTTVDQEVGSVQDLLNELGERTRRRDPTAEDWLAEHKRQLADALPAERFAMLCEQIEAYRFAAATEIIDELLHTQKA